MYISLRGIVVCNDSILMIKKIRDGKEYYIFPGGHWDIYESIRKGVEREIYEETGVKAVSEYCFKTILNIKKRRLEIYYKCSLIGNQMDDMVPTLQDAEMDIELWQPLWVPINIANTIPIKDSGVKCIIQKILRRGA